MLTLLHIKSTVENEFGINNNPTASEVLNVHTYTYQEQPELHMQTKKHENNVQTLQKGTEWVWRNKLTAETVNLKIELIR